MNASARRHQLMDSGDISKHDASAWNGLGRAAIVQIVQLQQESVDDHPYVS